MRMKFISAFAAPLAVLLMAAPALAHCHDARKTCEFAARCMQKSSAHAQKIRDGVHKGKAAGGNEIWSELAQCAVGGVEWSPSDASGEGNRSYDDIAAGCSPADYMATGKAGAQLFDGAQDACNQLPE